MPNRVDAQRKPAEFPINLDYLRSKDWWSKVMVGSEDECWLWTQSCGSHGYGQTWDSITVRLAHRVAWELTNGPIENGMTIDHICRVRKCCNPAHLRLLSNVENARDNGRYNVDHCINGHLWTKDNTYITPSTGARRCRTCQRLWQQRLIP